VTALYHNANQTVLMGYHYSLIKFALTIHRAEVASFQLLYKV